MIPLFKFLSAAFDEGVVITIYYICGHWVKHLNAILPQESEMKIQFTFFQYLVSN